MQNLCTLIRLSLFLFIAQIGIGCGDNPAKPSAANDGDLCELDSEEEQSAGTWCDPATGLVWQKDVVWTATTQFRWNLYACENLDLRGTGWRLPSIDELRTLITHCPQTQPDGACGIEADIINYECNGCSDPTWPETFCQFPSELTGPCTFYWSATSFGETEALVVHFKDGGISPYIKDNTQMGAPFSRCVRDR